MRILFINNNGSGYADYVDVAAGTTIDKFIAERLSAQQAKEATPLGLGGGDEPVQRIHLHHLGGRRLTHPAPAAGVVALVRQRYEEKGRKVLSALDAFLESVHRTHSLPPEVHHELTE